MPSFTTLYPALLFPAIPLMMTMYGHRYHTLSALIRKLHDQYIFEKRTPPEWEKQLHVLNNRTNLLKYTMGFAAFGFLFNMMTVLKIVLSYLNAFGSLICNLSSALHQHYHNGKVFTASR